MGILSKLKNVFFEEEIVEVEEEPKKVKKEEPVAKKIELPKVEKVEREPEYTLEEDELELEEEIAEKENKFPMDFDEEDFKEEKIEIEEIDETYESPSITRRSERRKTTTTYDDRIEEVFEVVEEQTITKEEPKYDFELEYGREKEYASHGLYEGKSAKKAFTPTPIISPIYGILDKNYKKDDVVTKKEIRLSSAPKKIDLDSVREKAYGDLTSDISQSMEEVKVKKYEEDKFEDDIKDLSEDENLLYDLNDNESPAVKKVTVGDAEEYFNELGLEYNVDYKDDSIEQTKMPKERTRRTTLEEEPVKTSTKDDEIVKEDFDDDSDDDGLESNLFDLIESMYDEKE